MRTAEATAPSPVAPQIPMQDTLNALLAKAPAELAALRTRAEFEAAKARYVGPNGEFTALMKQGIPITA